MKTPKLGKISRIRELRAIKQEAMAELGVSQQTVSQMEQSETVEDDVLEKVAKVLGVTSASIKSFSEKVPLIILILLMIIVLTTTLKWFWV